MKAQYQSAAVNETVLWGCKVGEPDYMEEVLFQQKGYVNKEELMTKANQWAKDNGYDRLRLAVYDLNEKPDFIKTIK